MPRTLWAADFSPLSQPKASDRPPLSLCLKIQHCVAWKFTLLAWSHFLIFMKSRFNVSIITQRLLNISVLLALLVEENEWRRCCFSLSRIEDYWWMLGRANAEEQGLVMVLSGFFSTKIRRLELLSYSYLGPSIQIEFSSTPTAIKSRAYSVGCRYRIQCTDLTFAEMTWDWHHFSLRLYITSPMEIIEWSLYKIFRHRLWIIYLKKIPIFTSQN